MSQYVVIYIRIYDKDDLVIEGPYYGKLCESFDDAEAECRKLYNDALNNYVIPRIYQVADDDDHFTVMQRARDGFFAKIIEQIREMI